MKKYLLLHLFLFAFGYSSFTFSLFPYTYFLGASPQYQGILGFLLMVPNVVLPYFFIKLKNPEMVFKLIILSTLISLFSISYISFSHNLSTILILTLILGIGQFIWWITTEIYFTMVSEGSNLINLYGIFWGSAYFISPFLAGYIVNFYSFRSLFILTILIISLSLVVLLLSREKGYYATSNETMEKNEGKISMASFFPSFSVGLIIGTLISIFPGYLLSSGMNITQLGYINTAMNLTRLVGFIMLSRVKDQKITLNLLFLSFLIELLIIIPFFTNNFFILILSFAILGFGFSFGIFAPLIYIAQRKDLDVSKNISIYEFSFGISTSLSSILSGYIVEKFDYGLPFLIEFFFVLISLSIFYLAEKPKQ